MPIQSGQVLLQANFNVTKALGGSFGSVNIATPLGGSAQGLSFSLTAGSLANQINNYHESGQSVTAGTPLLLNLTSGALLMPDGAATNFADIEFFYVKNTGLANLTLGGGSNAVSSILGATGTIIIAPGEPKILACNFAAAAFTVTPSTANILQFVAASGTVTFDLMLAGH